LIAASDFLIHNLTADGYLKDAVEFR